LTAYAVASRFVGLHEIEGGAHHPLIQYGFLLCGWHHDTPDEVPWCSAFMVVVAHVLGLSCPYSARARTWLTVGEPTDEPDVGDTVVILWRGARDDGSSGHVGLFAGFAPDGRVKVLGGNQQDEVNITPFPTRQVLGYRRLE
jgi:uncharacterized protein (TIGR02594 family)